MFSDFRILSGQIPFYYVHGYLKPKNTFLRKGQTDMENASNNDEGQNLQKCA